MRRGADDGLFSVLLLVGFVGAYFKWIAAAVAGYFAWRCGQGAWARHCEDVELRAAEQRAIAKRADRQHRWAVAGDPRGTYGDYPPAA